MVKLATQAMGTRFEVVIDDPDAVRARAAGEAALAEVEAWHNRLSPFQRDSEVSRLNELASGRAIRIDGELFALLALCRDVWAQSGGAFDITVGPLMHALGFRGGPEGPTTACTVGMHLVELDADGFRVRFREPGLSLDLGAVGKGFAIDRAIDVLREAGIVRALVHGGTSTVAALGAPPGMGGWPIAVGPFEDAPVVLLNNSTLSVSAPHGRTVQGEAGEVSHVLDPRTRRPAMGADITAVVCPSAALGDAWSTALLVLRARPATMPDAWTSMIGRRAEAGVEWSIEGPANPAARTASPACVSQDPMC